MLGIEFLVAFQVELALQVVHRNDDATCDDRPGGRRPIHVAKARTHKSGGAGHDEGGAFVFSPRG
jgi:hypothetical protein